MVFPDVLEKKCKQVLPAWVDANSWKVYLWQLSKVASTEIKCFFFNFFPSTGACLLAPADAVSASGESFKFEALAESWKIARRLEDTSLCSGPDLECQWTDASGSLKSLQETKPTDHSSMVMRSLQAFTAYLSKDSYAGPKVCWSPKDGW